MQGPQLVAMRAEAQERLMDRRIREEQDNAYEEALLQHQEREQREAEEQERSRRESAIKQAQEAEAAAAAREAEEAERCKAQEKAARKEQLRAGFEAEDEAAAGPGTALMAFKLPCGARLQRRFLASQPVQRLYDYLDAYGNIEFQEFEIATNLPRVVYNDGSISIEEAGLAPQAMLFVSERL